MKAIKQLADHLANDNILGGASPDRTQHPSGLAALYARHANGPGAEASIDRQVETCTAWAEVTGLRVVATYVDGARAAEGARNEGLARLVRDAEAGRFGVLLVENIDRLARDLGSLGHLFRALADRGVSIHIPGRGVLMPRDVFPRGQMGDEQRRLIAERVRSGRNRMAMEGRFPLGPCFGYRAVPGKPGTCVIDEAEAAVVRRAFEMRATGMSRPAILAALQGEVPTGGILRLSLARLRDALRNSRYVGVLVFNRTATGIDRATGRRRTTSRPASEWIVTSVPEARIVDQETWNRVRALEDRQGVTDADRRRPHHP